MTSTTGIGVHDQNLERQIEKHMGGCMAGFFNLFDRSHLLSGKRLYPKRLPAPLPSSAVAHSASEPVSAVESPACSREFKKSQPPTPEPELRSPVIGDTPKAPLAVSTFEFKEAVKSPWKFSREAPRLSLDSRAVVDAKGELHPRQIRINTTAVAVGDGDEERENQRRSPSVIARLMGLEPLPSSTHSVSEAEIKKVELRRSASESRSRDYRFFDAPSFFSPKAEISGSGERKSDQFGNIQKPNCNTNAVSLSSVRHSKAKNQNQNNSQSSNQRRVMVERKSYYDTADFFPPEKYHHHQHQHQGVTIYGEIEKRLRMRGIDEPSKDLETVKNILEALQLKGLLHSSTTGKPHRNLVGDQRLGESFESPIVLMKPARTPPAIRRNVEPSVSPRRARSPGWAENRSSGPTVSRKDGSLSIETHRRGSETTTLRGSSLSPARSPRKTRRPSSDQTVNRSPRSRRSTVETERVGVPSGPEDDAEASTISESSSHTDNERWRAEEYREGRTLLERCDKLLHSIAEMNSNPNPNPNSNSNSVELPKPSPVSVLDSSFYKEDESSPSPVKKRNIDFKDEVVMELEDEEWSASSSRSQLLLMQHLDHRHHQDTGSISDDSDFSYVSEVFRASMYLPQEKTDLFLLLEKKQGSIRGGKDKSKASILQRRLIFDTITEILDRTRQLPPWKAISESGSSPGQPTLGQIWAEFQKIQERGQSEDLLEVICGVLKKDLAGDSLNGWGDCHVEVSEAVLDIERLIFKDLITETIRDLAAFDGKSPAPRRKLVF